MFCFGSPDFWGAWFGAVYLSTILQVAVATTNHRGPLVLRNQHSHRRGLHSKGLKLEDESLEPVLRDLNMSESLWFPESKVPNNNLDSWKYSPQVFVTLDSTSNSGQHLSEGQVQFTENRKQKNQPDIHHQEHHDDYYSYKLQQKPEQGESEESSLTSPTMDNSEKKDKCRNGGHRSREGAKQLSRHTTNDAATSWMDHTGVLPSKKLFVRLVNDVPVRSDLLLVRTPDNANNNHHHHHNNVPIVRGLEVRNLSGSWFPHAAFEQRTTPLIVRVPAGEVVPSDYLASRADESRLQSREDNPSAESRTGADWNNVRGQLVVRASSSASQGIRVIQEPGALGLVMNQRGLIVAPKRSSYPATHSSTAYNASALFTNHIDHSLSPVKVTPHTGAPVNPDPNRLSFLGQRPPLVSAVRWRNTTKPVLAASPETTQADTSTQHSYQLNSLWSDLISRPQTSHYSSTSATTSVPTQTATPTTQRPNVSTPMPPQFLHNPPYKQNLANPYLDLASSQQLVQEYDQKLASRTRPKQQSNKRPTGADLNSTLTTHHRPNANRLPTPMELVASGSSNHPLIKEHSNSSSSYSHESFSTKPPFELNSTISPQLNTLNHNNNEHSSLTQITTTHSPISSHPMKPSLTSSTGANGAGKFMNKLQHLIIGKILKNQALGNAPSGGTTSSITYGYHQSSSSTPTSLVPQPQPQQQTAIPAPLLSSTVANNVASLLAQKLSSIFVKSVGPSLAASGYIVNPGVAGQSSGQNVNPLSGISSGLSSLFGHRVGPLPSRPSSSMKQRFPNNIHSPIKRRTVGMGSLLASGLIYGISLLPALMALTGINPLAGSARTSNPTSPAQADVKSSQPNSQQSASASTNNIRKLPAPQDITPVSPGNNQVSPIQGTIAYLMPVIPALPSSLGPEEPLLEDNDAPLDHLSYSGSDADDSVQLNHNAHHNYHQMFESAYINNLHPHIANPIIDSPPPSMRSHPYSKYKGHLYYSRSLAPPSTSEWPEQDTESSQHSAVMESRKKKAHRNRVREPIMSSNSDRQFHLTSGSNQPTSRDTSSNTFSTLASTPIRSFQVGYSLSYKPLQETTHQQQNRPHSSYIEFQDVNDLVDDGSASHWRPLIAQRGFANRAKFNLNQSYQDFSGNS